jgi:uncharacterized protein
MIESEKLVRSTWDAFTRGDVKAAFTNLADDVTWSIPGSIPNLSGTKRGKDGIFAFLGSVAKVFPAGLKSEVKHVHAAGDTVVLEMTNRGTTADGKPYENDYCFVFEVDGGKIRRIREYVDTQRAAAILGL